MTPEEAQELYRVEKEKRGLPDRPHYGPIKAGRRPRQDSPTCPECQSQSVNLSWYSTTFPPRGRPKRVKLKQHPWAICCECSHRWRTHAINVGYSDRPHPEISP